MPTNDIFTLLMQISAEMAPPSFWAPSSLVQEPLSAPLTVEQPKQLGPTRLTLEEWYWRIQAC